MNTVNLLLRHSFVAVPADDSKAGSEALATILMNLSYYGFALSVEAYTAVSKLGPESLASWWCDLESELKSVSGEDRKMADFVVYKNFPAEVLDKSESEYWIAQILMYWGLPNELFTQEVKPRAKMKKQPPCKVLHLAKADTCKDICTSLLSSAARWKDEEFADVLFLTDSLPFEASRIGFKENLVRLVSAFIQKGRTIPVKTGTDVLRLAMGMSGGDVSLREKAKFASFSKPIRRYLLGMLENCSNLEEDVARRPELWKRFLHQLHAADYKAAYPNVRLVQDQLYKDQLTTFNSQVEKLLAAKDANVLRILAARPGEFRRRLVHTLDLFGFQAAEAFSGVVNRLTTHQVVSLRTYLESVNDRFHRVFPPKGNWNKLQVGEARWVEDKYLVPVRQALTAELVKRLPKVRLDSDTRMVKLPSNDGEVSPYARGTVFPLPEVEFIRTASFWKCKTDYNSWFDNGWNFFSSDWKDMGSICWNATNFGNGAAVFSGDPTNTKDVEGRACQLIDLYLDKLRKAGVRYAVWNVLCFSRIPFSKATEVFAALQWGKDAQSGKLFEPSRCQLAFPLKGEQLTKFVCLIDLERNEMVYLDANLRGQVNAASSNGKVLSEQMPAFMEYLRSLPSVHDLFRDVHDPNSDTHVLYTDKYTTLNDTSAYVFKPENQDSRFKPMDLNGLLT